MYDERYSPAHYQLSQCFKLWASERLCGDVYPIKISILMIFSWPECIWSLKWFHFRAIYSALTLWASLCHNDMLHCLHKRVLMQNVKVFAVSMPYEWNWAVSLWWCFLVICILKKVVHEWPWAGQCIHFLWCLKQFCFAFCLSSELGNHRKWLCTQSWKARFHARQSVCDASVQQNLHLHTYQGWIALTVLR